PRPSFMGWNSSYDGKAFPEEQMQEWLESTVRRIAVLAHPSKVLEIGCGPGLLLERLAPSCKVYRATEVSSEALGRLRSWITCRDDLSHVELEQSAPVDLSVSNPHGYDTVILNSIVRYFPDAEYLIDVLRKAAALISLDGRIFVGDVRHFGLLRTFHTSVQLARARSGMEVRELRRRIARAVTLEQELVIDPRFFEELPTLIPEIRSARVELRRGQADNELTCYRYDVLLEVQRQHDPSVGERINWSSGRDILAELSRIIHERRPHALHVSGIANRRIAADIAAAQLVESSRESWTAGDVRKSLEGRAFSGEDPEEFWRLGERYGYEVRVSWSAGSDDGRFDVALIDPRPMRTVIGQNEAQEEQHPTQALSRRQLLAYVNDPLGRSVGQQLIPKLREHLKETLPSYMVPSAFVLLSCLPVGPNGKLNRRELPAPDVDAYSSARYEAPLGEVEETLAALWQTVLQIESVGRHDNFFELGGHSLLLIQLMAKMRQLGLFADTSRFLENPTLLTLAHSLVSRSDKEVIVPPNLIPKGCDHITPSMLPLLKLSGDDIESIANAIPGGAANIQDIYPLAPLQEGLLFHHLLDGGRRDAYVLSTILSIASQSALESFICALQCVVDRHDALRSAIFWDHLPRPVQVVCRRIAVSVTELHMEQQQDALELLKGRMASPEKRLDLSLPPLITLEIAANPGREMRYVLLRTHHVICDYQSLEQMLAEVLAF